MRAIFERNIKLNMSGEDEGNFRKAKLFWICEQPFVNKCQKISLYLKKIEQNKLKSVQGWV